MTQESTHAVPLRMRPMQDQADADAFRTLNEQWISELFRLEDKDRLTLGDPQGSILAKGGQVYVALAGGEVVGCVALIAFPDRVYELSKMAVSPLQRGRGIGRSLLLYAIEQARLLGGRALFLGSSTKLANAVRLYESVGFRHVAPAELPPMPYVRADVFMKLNLSPADAGAAPS